MRALLAFLTKNGEKYAMKTKPKIIPDIGQVEALAANGLTQEQIALALGISPATLYARKRENKEFVEAIKRGKAKGIALVTNALMTEIKTGNTAAMIFFLKTQGGWKETIKQEVTGANGAPIEVNAKTVENLSNEELMKIAQLNDNT